MRIALDPGSIENTTKTLLEGAAELSMISIRLRNSPLPAMPYAAAEIANAGIQQAAATTSGIALVLIHEAQEMTARVAMLRCGAVGGWDLAGMFGFGLGVPGSSRSDLPQLERGFLEEQGVSWLAWLSGKGADHLLVRLDAVNELLDAAGASYDEALELFEQGRYWDVVMKSADGAVPVDEFAHLFSQSKKLQIMRVGLRGLGHLGNAAGAAVAYDHSVARSRTGRSLSALGSIVFTRTGPLIAYDTATGGAGTATADLLAVSLESIADMEVELDELKAWSDANASGENGWMLQRYAQLGDAIGDSDSLSMYEVDDDGELRLGPPWRWFD